MFLKRTMWISLTAITLGLSTLIHAKACSGTVRELTDVGRRGPSYAVNSSSEPTISDSTLPTGWYVAKDGVRYYTMVNGTAPRYAYCGTDNPIYIKDRITKLEEGKEYQDIACLVNYDTNCTQRYNVKVRQCGQEIQYYLLPTDGTSAYCFEPSSVTGVASAPNYRIYDRIQVSVALMYNRANKRSEPELEFKCNFGSARNQYFYGVNWVINGRIRKTFTPVKLKDVDNTNLNETMLRSLGFSFGLSIQCAVRISSTPTGNQTSPQMSDTFYAGVKVLNPRIQLTSGRSADINLQPTIPLGCRRPDALPAFRQESCSVDIEMFDPNSKYSCKDTSVTSISNQKLCGSSMAGWRNTTSQACMHRHNVNQCTYTRIKSHLQIQTIRITVTNDRLQYPDDKTFTLQLRTGNVVPHAFWQNARLDDVTIIYTGGSQNLEWRGRKCSVINDPYLYTFEEGSTYMKDFGHYLLYNNTKYSTDVQIKTQKCDADHPGSCTCAVAIHAGGDVFLMDTCDKIKRASFIHCRSNKLNVIEKTNTHYEIYLPTGTKVEVNMGHWNNSDFLKVYITPSPSDVRNTEGLCGNLNGHLFEETLNSRYFTKWRLQNSLFNTVRYDLPSTWTYDYNVCICPQAIPGAIVPSSLSSGVKNSRAFCFSQQYATCTESTILQGERKVCTIRNKRSAERHRRNIERLHALSASHKSSHDRIRKSIANVQPTEAQAYKECLDVFKSKPTYSMIDDLPVSVSLNESLSACVNDMVVDGRKFWKEESYDSWVSVISQEIGRNGTFRKEKENVVRSFRSITCPSQCHGNGDCVNGTCICKDDYVGDSCFVKKSDPLELTDIEGGGECDLAYGDDCHECLQFHTVNLLKGFKCKIDTHDLDVNGTVVQSTEHKRRGEYDSIFDGYCCPSAAEGRRRRSTEPSGFTVRYSISISNDGIHFGPSRNVHVFDSTCQTYVMMANGEWMFSLREDTCYINGLCHRNGDHSIVSTNLICCPLAQRYKWTTRQECTSYERQPRNTSENDKTAIVAVCVSVAGILIVACVVVFAIWTYKNKKRTVSSTKAESEKNPDYDKLSFRNPPGNTKFQSDGRPVFNPSNIDVFVTEYEQLRK